MLTMMMLTGCDSARLEKQNQELLARLRRQQAVQDFDLQSKCSLAAKTYFGGEKEEYRTSTVLGASLSETLATLKYTDHFSKSLNRCMIEISHFVSTPGKGLFLNVHVYDVFERETYGSYFGPTNPMDGSPTSCRVDEGGCQSYPDFEAKIKRYMAD